MKPKTATFTSPEKISINSTKLYVFCKYTDGLKFSRFTQIKYPPKTPIISPIKTRNGSDIIPAITLGDTRYEKGFVDKVLSASICSVTFIVPISAAIAAPARPATINPANTGASSLVIDSTTTLGMALSAENLEKPVYDCKANTIPVKIAVRPTTGKELKPILTI